jgi:3-oxoacyl-[acyl-carrier-protein] synthase-3
MTDRNAYVTRTSSFLPNAPVGNDDMERILGQVGQRPSRARRLTLRSNGITSRYFAIDPITLTPNFTNASLAAQAIRGLSGPGFALEDTACLVCGTSIADQLLPNHTSMVQGELGMPPCEAVATAGVCLSGMTALKYAAMVILSGAHPNAIASGSELSSAMMKAGAFTAELDARVEALERHPEIAFEQDFLRWMLSDGAGAVLVQPTPQADGISLRIDWIDILSYAGEMETCMYAGALKEASGALRGWQQFSEPERAASSVMAVKQDVKLLNSSIVEYSVEKPLVEIMPRRGLRPQDIDYFLPHMSSYYFQEPIYAGLRRAGLDIPPSRWFTNLATKGNVGSASIYLMLDEIFTSGRLHPGQRLLCFVPESGRFSTCWMQLTVV